MGVLKSFSDEVSAIVNKVGPAVLHVRAIRERSGGLASGSGLIVSEDGLAVTNAHVVRGAAAIEVVLSDGRTVVADLVGEDTRTDVAVLRIPLEGLPFAPLAESTGLRVGDFAIAIGAPCGSSWSVTSGIISTLGRPLQSEVDGGLLEGVVQLDAPLDPRLSGGPLLNHDGEVVGVTSALFFPAQGLVYAAPASTVRIIVSELVRCGRIRRAYLGIGAEGILIPSPLVKSLDLETDRGVAIRALDDSGPGFEAGLRMGDLIIALNGELVRSIADLHRTMHAEPVGTPMEVEVLRGRERLSMTIRAGEVPLAA